MSTDPLKLDSSLDGAYREWIEMGGAERDPDSAVSVVVRFEGDVHALEEAGFAVAAATGDQVVGTIRFADLAALATHPNVVWISGGRERRATLDTAVRDVVARASSTGTIGGGAGDGLWHVDVASGTLTAAGGATGAGVVVAVIDTGIDITHPMFHRSIAPYDTRIVRIWDQGLTPVVGEHRPDPALLVSTSSFGVEYDKAAIDAALNGSGFPVTPLAFRHRDCIGHGTHVASTAAGGSTFSAGADASRVGVAPDADIVLVKMLDTPGPIVAADGTLVSPDVVMRDAIVYCGRVARAAAPLGLGDRPVVINCSFGSTWESGDGLDDDDVFLNRTFDPAAAAGPMSFPSRAILVKSAGNDGNVTRRNHATITIPDSGTIDVPFELFDTRGANKNRFTHCAQEVYVPGLFVSCWARRIPAPNNTSVAARVPTEAAFSAPVFEGHLTKQFGGRKERTIRHTHVGAVQRPVLPAGTVPVQRDHITLEVEPNRVPNPPQHALGIYDLRFTGPPGTVIHALCEQSGLPTGRIGFRVATQYRPVGAAPPAPLPPAQTIAGVPGIVPIEVTATSTIVDAGARNIITVAAYDDTNGVAAAATHHHAALFSSRGPLRDFTDPALGPLVAKPDISAPGVAISAAHSKDTETLIPIPAIDVLRGNRFVEFQGTSMSAPIITGVIALMLEKNPDLSVDEVRTAFAAIGSTRPGADPPLADPLAPGAFGAGMVHALNSHTATP